MALSRMGLGCIRLLVRGLGRGQGVPCAARRFASQRRRAMSAGPAGSGRESFSRSATKVATYPTASPPTWKKSPDPLQAWKTKAACYNDQRDGLVLTLPAI